MQLIAENLVLVRGSRAIIDGLSFTVAGGEALVLKGANGSGKTTLIRALAGFLRPAAGAIRLDGGDDEREPFQQCHYVGHANGLKSSLTVAENLAFWADYLDPSGAQQSAGRVERALARVDLEPLAQIPAGYLSAGQKRRVALARLFVAGRHVWLLDEPSVSLDDASTALLIGAVEEHLAAGGIAVIATHAPLAIAAATLELGRTAEAAA